MSGLLGQILGNVMGGQQPGQSSAVVGVLQQVIAQNGGVAGIAAKFQSSGLGSAVQSWIGTGANQPVNQDQIGQVFSAQQIAGWASQAGTTPDKLRAVLAEALPQAVDHLTPGGQVPPAGAAAPDLASLVTKFLGSAAQR
jgi:uncharacterized protein YidB (DUF937 family)